MRITNATDLPDWFDTSKYENAIHLDARAWCEQLSAREECLVMASSYDPNELFDSEFYGFKPIEFLSAVRMSPIFSYYGSQFEQTEQHPLRPDDEYPPGIVGATRPTTLVDSPYIKPIGLDLTLPDEILHQSFRIYLSQVRKERRTVLTKAWGRRFDEYEHVEKLMRSNTFIEWCNCGLLQYLDLKIWSIQEDTKISNKALAYGIFPNNQEKGEENIRTTTKKHAAMILDESNARGMSMTVLWAYARLEDFVENQEPH